MDKNLSSGEFGKISKYKDLEIEIEWMWHLKPTLIPAVEGAPGTLKKGTNEYLQQIPIKLLPKIYLQLLYMYNSQFAITFILFIHILILSLIFIS